MPLKKAAKPWLLRGEGVHFQGAKVNPETHPLLPNKGVEPEPRAQAPPQEPSVLMPDRVPTTLFLGRHVHVALDDVLARIE